MGVPPIARAGMTRLRRALASLVAPARPGRRPLWLAVVLSLAIGGTALAQRGGYRYAPFAEPTNPRYDGQFMFARLKYSVGPGGYYYRGLPAWAHGEPFAEENLMKIMDSVSLLAPHIDEGVVLSLDDPDLMKFPVSYMTEAGFWTMSDDEGKALAAYLKKGGFVIFDDFRDPPRGGGGYDNFLYNIQRAMPGIQPLPMDISHPIFHAFYEIDSFDLVPQAYDNFVRPSFLGLFEDNDPKKRLMAIVNYNTDIADFWEFSGRGWYPVDSSNEAYKLGVNYIIYGLTH
jgi:hypothetical protein